VILVTFLHYVLVTLAKRQTAMLLHLEDAAYRAVCLCSLLMSDTLFSTTGWHQIIFIIL